MKKIFVFLMASGVSICAFAQEIQKDLKPFSRIIASPRINVILTKGDRENIRLVYNNVSKENINIEVRGKTLHLYLDHAKKIEKMSPYDTRHGWRRQSMYEGVTITAYVTYEYLESLEIRGRQELVCNDPIDADQFRLRAYGENEITFASLKTDFFKASLYGENHLNIRKGKVVEQKYKLFGENKIDTKDMRSAFVTASIFGEGRVNVNASENVRVDSFGEPTIYVNGGGNVNKRLVFGRMSLHRD